MEKAANQTMTEHPWHGNELLKKSEQISFSRDNAKVGKKNIFLQAVQCILFLSRNSSSNSVGKD